MRRTVIVVLLCCFVVLIPEDDKPLRLINDQIKNIKQKLQELKKDKGSVLSDIYEIELRYEKEKIESNKIDLQQRDTRQKINRMEGEKRRLEEDINRSKADIKKVIRILYKFGSNAHMKLFTNIDSLDQLFRNYRLLLSLIDSNMREINIVKEKIGQVERLKTGLEIEYQRILKFKNEKMAALEKMRAIKNEKLLLISNINKDKSNYLRMLDELKYEADRLNQLIHKQGIKEDMRIIDVDRLKGKLVWPIKGKIITSFGKERSTRFDTYIFNNGIKIKPSDSSEVNAVYFGEVIYADYFMGGYGNLIIVEHAKNFHSLYGHCEKFFKKQGDKVMEGECIALVGETGSVVGKSLHFEIRKDLKAENPMIWLQGEK